MPDNETKSDAHDSGWDIHLPRAELLPMDPIFREWLDTPTPPDTRGNPRTLPDDDFDQT